jgi:hypothetical protein
VRRLRAIPTVLLGGGLALAIVGLIVWRIFAGGGGNAATALGVGIGLVFLVLGAAAAAAGGVFLLRREQAKKEGEPPTTAFIRPPAERSRVEISNRADG